MKPSWTSVATLLLFVIAAALLQLCATWVVVYWSTPGKQAVLVTDTEIVEHWCGWAVDETLVMKPHPVFGMRELHIHLQHTYPPWNG